MAKKILPSPAPPKQPTESQLLKAIDAALAACREHVPCSRCYCQIVDDEGNPGLFSECCKEGLPLLQAYVDTESDYLNHKRRAK